MVRGVLAAVFGLILAVLVAVAGGALAGLPLLGAAAGSEPLLARLVKAAWAVLLLALPVSFAAIAVGEARRLRNWDYWGLAGVIVALCGYIALKHMGDAVAPEMTAGRAPLTFSVIGLLGGIAYWWIAGRNAGALAKAVQPFFYPVQDRDKGDSRRCALCAAAGLLLGLIPLALLGWYAFHKSTPPMAKSIAAKAERDGDRMLKDAGLPALKFSVDQRPYHEHIGHVSGNIANYAAKADALKRAKSALAPMVGMPGVVAVLQDDIIAVDETDPQVAAENTRIRAAQEAAQSLAREAAELKKADLTKRAAEAEAKRKAGEEAAAKEKAEEEARLTAEAVAKRKADEEAAAKKKAEEEARLAAEAKAKREASEDAAKKSPPPQAVPAESNWTPGNGMSASAVVRASCVGDFGQLFASEAIRFTMKSAALESQHASFLDKLGNLAKRCDGIGLLIEGNADAWGAEDFNLQLSEQRAEAVRAALVERGVSSKQLATRGFGELKPLIRERSREADAANRRVDFGVIEIEKILQTIQPQNTGPAKN